MFSFVGFLLLVAMLLAAALMSLAMYNVARWQGDTIPDNSISRLIITSQLVLVLILLVTAFTQIIAMFAQLSNQKWKHAALCLMGVAVSVFAIFFTMIFDSGSVFFQ